eukprot:TRINITY_DN12548_c1_g1_i2.p2 TRINITY_DN12548_c1_g1~~TRINITY_DN12548_c1_g1_i2.p2  ORF type:complete len:109 (+),score=1.09 TRINITY_DN12548_c1_g1_i2:836-1162(+)
MKHRVFRYRIGSNPRAETEDEVKETTQKKKRNKKDSSTQLAHYSITRLHLHILRQKITACRWALISVSNENSPTDIYKVCSCYWSGKNVRGYPKEKKTCISSMRLFTI